MMHYQHQTANPDAEVDMHEDAEVDEEGDEVQDDEVQDDEQHRDGEQDQGSDQGEEDDRDIDQDEEDKQDQDDELKGRWAQILNEQIELLIQRRDCLIKDPTPPSVGQATSVNPNLIYQALQVGSPMLSTGAKNIRFEGSHYPDEFAEEDAETVASGTRAPLNNIIGVLAGLEFNLGTLELEGDFAYNAKRTIEIWRGYALAAFQQMCHEEARVFEYRYARLFLQGGPRAEDRVKPPKPRCEDCYLIWSNGEEPEPGCSDCARIEDNWYLHYKLAIDTLKRRAGAASPFYKSRCLEDEIEESPESYPQDVDDEETRDWYGEREYDGSQPEEQNTITDNEDANKEDITMLDAATPTDSGPTSAQRATLLGLARTEGTSPVQDTNTDDNDTDVNVSTTANVTAIPPDLERAAHVARVIMSTRQRKG
ncbi:MAG: hypothetical protein L6R40_000385 [Gallowayella cf. fulva]|nr:MAG: hypothetical protein L6R40_000385 [Xanthomendoza cf. fulva]